MNKIEKLIEEYCPEGVEFRELGEVCKFQNGFAFKSSLFKKSGLPIIRITNIQNGNVDDFNFVYFDKSDYNDMLSQYEIRKGDILIAMSGATTGKIGYVTSNEILFLNQRVGKFIPYKKILNNRYLFHFLLTKTNNIYVLAGGGAQPNLSSSKLMKHLSIPIPPLPIQQEIANILDKFTQLEEDLNAELESRRTQYEFYLNQMMEFEGKEVEWKTLGEVGEFQRGKRFVKKDIVSSGVPCIHYGELYTYYKTWTKKTKSFIDAEKAAKLRVAKPGDVIIVTAGETIEDIGNSVAWLGESDVVIHDACFSYSHNFNPKFVSYYFQTNIFRSQIRKHISSGKISAILESGLSKTEIPIPPLSEQERIVSILDKFDALVNDTTIGLQSEIDARRKQYEYYRNKLLTFAEYE